MRVMIVDDEIIIREGLAKVIDWEILGLTLLEPAESAEVAIGRIAKEKPDILLTDIRMGRKDGLMLAEEARAILPDIEIIIFTGYDDFAYAQRAIRQNVDDYLLKTSRPEDIIKAVLQATQRINNKSKAKSKDFIKEKEIYKHMFEKWVIDGEHIQDDEEVYSYLPQLRRLSSGGHELWQVSVLRASGWEARGSSNALLLFAVDNMLQELAACETLVMNGMIVAAKKVSISSGNELTKWLAHIEKLLKCEILSASGQSVSALDRLAHSYRTAIQVSGYWELLCDKPNLNYSLIEHRKGGATVCSRQEETELSALLLSNDMLRLNEWTYETCKQQMNHPGVTYDSYLSYVQSIAIAGFRWLERAALEGEEWRSEIGLYTAFGTETNHTQVVRLQQYLQLIMQAYIAFQAKGKTVYRAIVFIKENLGSNQLSLVQTANYVSVHPGHLSEVFKKETGYTFSDYVTRERLAHAKELLQNPLMRVGMIARSVGYEDIKYFSQLFKKHYGQTPTEYRGNQQLQD